MKTLYDDATFTFLTFRNEEPMKPERASEIIAQSKSSATHGPWSDQISRFMRPDERRELLQVWKTMPGNTCFVDVLHSIANEKIPSMDAIDIATGESRR